jgi:hypothetical protein
MKKNRSTLMKRIGRNKQPTGLQTPDSPPSVTTPPTPSTPSSIKAASTMFFTPQDHNSDLLGPPSASPSIISSPSAASSSPSISSTRSDLAASNPEVVVVVPPLPDTPPAAAAASDNVGIKQGEVAGTELMVATMERVNLSVDMLRAIVEEAIRELTPLATKLANRMESDAEFYNETWKYMAKPFTEDFQARELVYVMCMAYLLSVVIYCITWYVVS